MHGLMTDQLCLFISGFQEHATKASSSPSFTNIPTSLSTGQMSVPDYARPKIQEVGKLSTQPTTQVYTLCYRVSPVPQKEKCDPHLNSYTSYCDQRPTTAAKVSNQLLPIKSHDAGSKEGRICPKESFASHQNCGGKQLSIKHQEVHPKQEDSVSNQQDVCPIPEKDISSPTRNSTCDVDTDDANESQLNDSKFGAHRRVLVIDTSSPKQIPATPFAQVDGHLHSSNSDLSTILEAYLKDSHQSMFVLETFKIFLSGSNKANSNIGNKMAKTAVTMDKAGIPADLLKALMLQARLLGVPNLDHLLGVLCQQLKRVALKTNKPISLLPLIQEGKMDKISGKSLDQKKDITKKHDLVCKNKKSAVATLGITKHKRLSFSGNEEKYHLEKGAFAMMCERLQIPENNSPLGETDTGQKGKAELKAASTLQTKNVPQSQVQHKADLSKSDQPKIEETPFKRYRSKVQKLQAAQDEKSLSFTPQHSAKQSKAGLTPKNDLTHSTTRTVNKVSKAKTAPISPVITLPESAYTFKPIQFEESDDEHVSKTTLTTKSPVTEKPAQASASSTVIKIKHDESSSSKHKKRASQQKKSKHDVELVESNSASALSTPASLLKPVTSYTSSAVTEEKKLPASCSDDRSTSSKASGAAKRKMSVPKLKTSTKTSVNVPANKTSAKASVGSEGGISVPTSQPTTGLYNSIVSGTTGVDPTVNVGKYANFSAKKTILIETITNPEKPRHKKTRVKRSHSQHTGVRSPNEKPHKTQSKHAGKTGSGKKRGVEKPGVLSSFSKNPFKEVSSKEQKKGKTVLHDEEQLFKDKSLTLSQKAASAKQKATINIKKTTTSPNQKSASSNQEGNYADGIPMLTSDGTALSSDDSLGRLFIDESASVNSPSWSANSDVNTDFTSTPKKCGTTFSLVSEINVGVQSEENSRHSEGFNVADLTSDVLVNPAEDVKEVDCNKNVLSENSSQSLSDQEPDSTSQEQLLPAKDDSLNKVRCTNEHNEISCNGSEPPIGVHSDIQVSQLPHRYNPHIVRKDLSKSLLLLSIRRPVKEKENCDRIIEVRSSKSSQCCSEVADSGQCLNNTSASDSPKLPRKRSFELDENKTTEADICAVNLDLSLRRHSLGMLDSNIHEDNVSSPSKPGVGHAKRRYVNAVNSQGTQTPEKRETTPKKNQSHSVNTKKYWLSKYIN